MSQPARSFPDPEAAAIGGGRRRGRGAVSNASGRFEPLSRIEEDDGWEGLGDRPPFRTEVAIETARTAITRNQSPDIAFDRSINPYRGCEHGCVYCFARPTHAYLGLSPGLDFESRLTAKPNVAELLRRELSAPGYKPRTIALGTNTDPYQPIEKTYRLTRKILEVLEETRHPVGIVTKSALVLRDLDILSRMAAQGLAKVAISVTTLDPELARQMEPRAPTPARRLATIAALKEAGVPVAVLTAPIIPALNDQEIDRLLESAAAAGASEAGYVLLRLPDEIKDLVQEWLLEHHPDKMRRILSLVRQTRGGKLYDAGWGKRQTGEGVIAWTIGRRFEIASRRLGLDRRHLKLRTDLFTPPVREGRGERSSQLSLF
ncbi:PA0069 family radical SAM protein [Hansschlegelia plantiphila]|uniref:Radical SAM protein n=1 Tax=Hansschlegelia plantiphila TaxID=374655 RepID=A0A9W6IZ08_9HYPH|nr:PA0069 family radical SAM protein [Hansschlegelia plantiphila]GLK67771.1 radical SAM protein [Hansschlegelia plantiphila]